MSLGTSAITFRINIAQMYLCGALENLCRVCGKAVMPKSAKVKDLCSQYTIQLMNVFGVDVKNGDPRVLPTHFCHLCLGRYKSLQNA